MSKQQRSPKTEKPPLSSHPLFPAIVALWFGALFGFGSLAIRPSLLETVVLATQIDSVFESAAPPIGMTARIILALIMAVIGAAIGGIFARMLSRPKSIKSASRRKARTAKAASGAEGELTGPTGFGRNSARAASAMTDAPPAKVRRRPLTVSNHDQSEPDDFVYPHDSAPLPGGAPEIFDVNASDLATWKQPEIETDTISDLPDALDLSSFVASGPASLNESSNVFDVSHDGFSNARSLPNAASPTVDIFSPISSETVETEHLFDFPTNEPKVTAVAPAIPVAYEPQAETMQSSHPSQFDAAEVSFAPGKQVSSADYYSDARHDIDFQLPSEDAPAQPDAFVPPPAIPTEFVPETIGDEPQGLSFPVSALNVTESHAETETLPEMEPAELTVQPKLDAQPFDKANLFDRSNLDSLSSAELLDRLAQSIRNHGAKSAAGTPQHTVTVETTPIAAELPIAVTPPAPAPASHRHLSIPAALKPISFSEYEDDDDTDSYLPQRLMTMPKASAAPLYEVAPTPEANNEAERPTLQNGFGGDAYTAVEPDVAEEEYSSLLDMGKPSQMRQEFLRIEEPDSDDGGIETVVVFPGQGGQSGSRFDAPIEKMHPVPESFEAATAPVHAQNPQPARNFAERPEFPEQHSPQFGSPSAPVAPAAIDPVETERALRSALANLQRMTGAA